MFNFLSNNVIWIIYFAALGVIFDALTTIYAVKNKMASEANGALNFIAKYIGFIPTVIVTHIAVLGVLYYFAASITLVPILIFSVFFWGVVIWNIYVIFQYKKL